MIGGILVTFLMILIPELHLTTLLLVSLICLLIILIIVDIKLKPKDFNIGLVLISIIYILTFSLNNALFSETLVIIQIFTGTSLFLYSILKMMYFFWEGRKDHSLPIEYMLVMPFGLSFGIGFVLWAPPFEIQSSYNLFLCNEKILKEHHNNIESASPMLDDYVMSATDLIETVYPYLIPNSDMIGISIAASTLILLSYVYFISKKNLF
jgi:hypothetical protein